MAASASCSRSHAPEWFMELYTFYPCKADGSAASFETFHLPDDAAALDRAAAVLSQHASCAYVAVWCGDRLVARRIKPEQRRKVA